MTLLMRRAKKADNIPPDPKPGYVFYDTVTRPDAAFSVGSASEKGGPWSVRSGYGGISHPGTAAGNGAIYSASAAGVLVAGTVGKADAHISMIVQSQDWNFADWDPMFRYQDDSNFLTWGTIGNENFLTFVLWQTIAGVETQFTTSGAGAGTGLSNSAEATFDITLVGTSFTAKINGVTKMTTTLTGAAAALGTQFGARHRGQDGANRDWFYNYIVQ